MLNRTLIFLMLTGLNFHVPVLANNLPDYSDLVQAVIPSVVTIMSSGDQGSSLTQLNSSAAENDAHVPFFLNTAASNTGSGFVLSDDGLILTNAHVVQNAQFISVQMYDGSTYMAEVVGRDDVLDLALLKIHAIELKPVTMNRDQQSLRVGQSVLGIGSPYAFEYSVTTGIVSFLGRTLSSAGMRNHQVSYIQTDMMIHPGNSGGPIINAEGQVIRMSSRIFSTTGAAMGISFGIPANIIDQVVKRMLNIHDNSFTPLGLLTVSIPPEQAIRYGLQKNFGALVTNVDPESLAGKSGLKANDVIVTVNDRVIRSSEELQIQLGLLEADERIEITAIRNGRYYSTSLQFPGDIEQ